MAEKRMFAKQIIDSDAFLDMPLSAQAYYFHLAMRADDDGFVNSPKKIQRIVGAGDDDAKLLIAKRFIIPFDSGVVVIKHWRVHNVIQKDRYKPTTYQEELATLELKPNKVYTERNRNGIGTESQNRLDEIRLEQNSVEEGAQARATTASPYTGANALHRAVFDLADGKAYTPTDERITEWVKAFPTIDIERALREAAAKNNAQEPKRRKNAVTIEPYIVNWLILESAQAEKAAQERKRGGFGDIDEHAPTNEAALRAELQGRNGNLI